MVKNDFFRISGVLWIDWVNTQAVSEGAVTELVDDFAELVAWLQAFGVISPQERREVESWSKTQQANVLQAARELRTDLRHLCAAIAAGKGAPQATLDVLNTHLARCALQMQLRRSKNGVEVIETLQLKDGLAVLFPIVRSAADWLQSADWTLLKKCANPDCILWFYDTSKNHSRRWCSMEGCGNRHKVTAHYRKKKRVL
jgi:predicted RNA-binding Zn ribbon-like protein